MAANACDSAVGTHIFGDSGSHPGNLAWLASWAFVGGGTLKQVDSLTQPAERLGLRLVIRYFNVTRF